MLTHINRLANKHDAKLICKISREKRTVNITYFTVLLGKFEAMITSMCNGYLLLPQA